jgi:2-polyprenyl-6-methoxyphenol hydroxylase-like FAD-dependent oxidoreductase
MTGFKYLFGSDNPVLTEMRNIGLNLVDHAGSVKQLFIKQALGEY